MTQLASLTKMPKQQMTAKDLDEFGNALGAADRGVLPLSGLLQRHGYGDERRRCKIVSIGSSDREEEKEDQHLKIENGISKKATSSCAISKRAWWLSTGSCVKIHLIDRENDRISTTK